MTSLENIFTSPGDAAIGFLTVADFDRVRVVATTIHQLAAPYERHVLRRTIQTLSVAGQVTHIEIEDLLRGQQWAYLIRVAGWLDTGAIEDALQTLRERLIELLEVWNTALAGRLASEEEGQGP